MLKHLVETYFLQSTRGMGQGGGVTPGRSLHFYDVHNRSLVNVPSHRHSLWTTHPSTSGVYRTGPFTTDLIWGTPFQSLTPSG